MKRFAVVPTRDRPGDLADAVKAIAQQVDLVIIIDNCSQPPVQAEDHGPKARALCYPDDPPNLSRAWNIGYSAAAAYAAGESEWIVATLNDDAIVPEGWLDAVVAAMEETGAAAGCSDPSGLLAEPLIHHQPGPVDLRFRLAGWAFVLRGEARLRADESMAWWYSDDDLSWRARQRGGEVIVPGFPVEHRYPNLSTVGERLVQAGRDRETFARKWGGQVPWGEGEPA